LDGQAVGEPPAGSRLASATDPNDALRSHQETREMQIGKNTAAQSRAQNTKPQGRLSGDGGALGRT
jgi:hypothetical protein